MKYSELRKRRGIFCIGRELFEFNHAAVIKLLSKVLIGRAGWMYCGDNIEYVGYSKEFEEVPKGYMAKRYGIVRYYKIRPKTGPAIGQERYLFKLGFSEDGHNRSEVIK